MEPSHSHQGLVNQCQSLSALGQHVYWLFKERTVRGDKVRVWEGRDARKYFDVRAVMKKLEPKLSLIISGPNVS